MIGIHHYLILLFVLRLNSYPGHERWQQWTSSEPVSSASRSRQTWFSTLNPRLLEGACFALENMCDFVHQWFQRFGGDDSGFIQESRACDHRSQSFEDGSKEKTFMRLHVVSLVEHEKLPICEGLLNTQAFLSCNPYGLFIVGLSYTLWQWPCPT